MTKIPVLVLFLSYVFSVVAQPPGNAQYVSASPGVLTFFTPYAADGFLAHSELAGGHFDELKRGDRITLKFADSSTRDYIVERVKVYKVYAVLPEGVLADQSIFEEAYDRRNRIVLQTCATNGRKITGLLIIVARPANRPHKGMIGDPWWVQNVQPLTIEGGY